MSIPEYPYAESEGMIRIKSASLVLCDGMALAAHEPATKGATP
jgi:hypothetical protein